MKASVIITTYKRAAFLLNAIESVLSQSVIAEVIVVDDNGFGSLEQIETYKVLEPYLDKIIYIALSVNSGACFARNKGIETAKGEYIFFLDDDDVFLPSKVEIQTAFLDNHLQLEGCLAAFKRINYETNEEILADSNSPVVGNYKNFVIKGNFFTPMLCIRKSAIEAIGGFDNIARFQDRYLMIKALLNNYNFEIINDALHIMYEHQDERITQAGVEKSLKSLDIIKNEVLKTKEKFTDKEWLTYLQKDFRMRGMFFYISKHYKIRLKGIVYFLKSFQTIYNIYDLKMIFKTILK
ncbi:glycosyltransferase family 2 protein [Epilithonimonas zeae]|uniref:glycosyltransferase family 2 protein n=1 Tax=Epilithonimonas zeae TaxID=1416779 RepID=UPI00200F014F|nr:glycosyltransferase family 2 protein [Epilithonimonas zeae]UQB67452.1 glycosyltransferase family 2 protein [Epilithonimonas zeae]